MNIDSMQSYDKESGIDMRVHCGQFKYSSAMTNWVCCVLQSHGTNVKNYGKESGIDTRVHPG